jgi:hypothetical protein
MQFAVENYEPILLLAITVIISNGSASASFGPMVWN